MKYMLDTNICIYAIKHKPDAVIKTLHNMQMLMQNILLILPESLSHAIRHREYR